MSELSMQGEENTEMKSLIQALVLPAAICAAGVALFWSLPAGAQTVSTVPAVDCALAEIPAEFAVCNSEELQYLDEQIGNLMQSLLVKATTAPQRQADNRAHQSWLRKRNSCGADFTCLELRYQERLDALSARDS